MNINHLLQLEKMATLTPKQIKKQDAAFFDNLTKKAAVMLKTAAEEQLHDAPKAVKEGLARIDFTPEKLGKQDIKTLLTKDLLKGDHSEKKKAELKIVAAVIPRIGAIDDMLQPDIPLVANPAFQEELAMARFYKLGTIIGLAGTKMEKALEKKLHIGNISNEKLDALVKDKTLNQKESATVVMGTNLYYLLDGNLELTEHVKKQADLQDIKNLVSIEKKEWEKWIKASKIALPESATTEAYAEFLHKKVENLFPDAAMTHRLAQVKTDSLADNLKRLQPLLAKNENTFGVSDFGEINIDGFKAAEIKQFKETYDKIDKIAKTHHGLQIGRILDNKDKSITEKVKIVQGRIDAFDKFLKNNENAGLLSLNYRHDSEEVKKLNFQGIEPSEKNMMLDNLKSRQRVYTLTDDIEASETVITAGFSSAYQVSSVTLEYFTKTTGFDSKMAGMIYENAGMSMIKTAGLMGSIVETEAGSFDWLTVSNTNTDIHDYLRDIPGYKDLFGAMAFCDCAHCQSIYSPAAYFVDLMQMVERNVLNVYFTGTKSDHVLNLKVRRPDLWTLPLTCENTSTLVPYLDIINEILESYIAQKKGFAGSLNDRSAVEAFVYKDLIALENKANWKNYIRAFPEPFHLPLVSLAAYLRHFELTRAQIGVLIQKPEIEIAKLRFELSDKNFQLITAPNANALFINSVYGLNLANLGGTLKPFDAQLLLKPMGVDRKTLQKILRSNFVTNYGADNIQIKGDKISVDSVQNDIEKVEGFTFNAMDRAHRFVRFWRQTPWSVEELDLLLSQLRNYGGIGALNTDAVTALGQLARLQDLLKITAEEACGILFRIPQTSVKEGQNALFDTLFNPADTVAAEGRYPKNTTKFIHPTLIVNKSTNPGEFLSARLSGAFNKSEDEILTLIKKLAQPLGIVALNAPLETNRGFLLTLQNLSLLYRHSRLAENLKVTVQDLFRLIALTPGIANGYVENVNHVFALIKFHGWWKKSNMPLDDLFYIIKDNNNVLISENYKDKYTIAVNVLNRIKAANAFYFADTVFAQFDDITETQSKAIIQQNNAVIALSPDGNHYQLTAAFNPATAITVPAGIGITRPEPELRAELIKYHPQYLAPYFLSLELQPDEAALARMISILNINLDSNALLSELQGITTPTTELPGLIEKLLPLDLLFKDRKYTPEALAYVLNHLAQFGIADLNAITVNSIQKLHTYRNCINIKENGDSNISSLIAVLNAFSNATQFQTANAEKLAALLGCKTDLLPGLHPLINTVTNPMDAIDQLLKLSETCTYIGIGGEVLPKIVDIQYTVLNEATNAILAAFRSKYPTEVTRKEKLEKYQDLLRGKKRTALTTYLIHNGFPQFENDNDLFNYFLIDTQLEGCARTSRLVAATMSLQVYVHRILLNLEQDDHPPGTPNRVYIEPGRIPAAEWVWRKNYRVWEANRKVFLYPENYIEPELRDDKSPLFEDLEKELLQKEINADNVLDAYSKYMRGFDEVAHLKIAGSYHEKDTTTDTDVLHLFGVSAEEPPTYYYRSVENVYFSEKRSDRGIVWNPWQKINVQIPVRCVSPITYNGRLHAFWVGVTTLPKTVFEDSRSVFTGYEHKFTIDFTTLKLDGTWTTPQKLSLSNCYPFTGNGVLIDPLAEPEETKAINEAIGKLMKSFPFFDLEAFDSAIRDGIKKLRTPRYEYYAHPHYEPESEYTLKGFLWDRVYPSISDNNLLILTGAGFQMYAAIDFYNLATQDTGWRDLKPGRESMTFNTHTPKKTIIKKGQNLLTSSSSSLLFFDNFAYTTLKVNAQKTDELLNRHWNPTNLSLLFNQYITENSIAQLHQDSTVSIVNNSFSDGVIDVQGDLLFLQGSVKTGNSFLLKRLGTTLSETLTRTLFTSGIDKMLHISTQKALREASTPLTIVNEIENRIVSNKIDFKGAYGVYYREIFFHIPFLIANHLNSQGKYADAQKWYHYIFNPTANEVTDLSNPALTAAQKKKMEMDRNWQYLEFREIDIQKLRDQLTNAQAIETYKKDPFNPHAIARLRLSAYQKCIVMKYIDNLLDWGDQLFAQDTMESINEATLLYIIAKEILGNRPPQIGDCGEGAIVPKTYETIKPALDKGSEFLAEMETYTTELKPGKKGSKEALIPAYTIAANAFKTAEYLKKTAKYEPTADAFMIPVMDVKYGSKTTVKPADEEMTSQFSVGINRTVAWKKDSIYAKDKDKVSTWSVSFVKQISPVFCIPGNKDLLDYYNRVDDRLYKIRNCMNIQGIRRQLALFAPEIDPRFLVRARAAGLSLEDILDTTGGNLPPYRFAYILERAKAITSVVQSFGASLFSAIEKKNSEELALLRMTQQQNILELTSKTRKLEVDSAIKGIEALNDRIESLSYQIAYYDGLISENRNPWEITQSISKHAASAIYLTESVIDTASAIFAAVPQLGSPFAMKYGGVELGTSIRRFGNAIQAVALGSEAIAASAGLEAGFDRRSEGWEHQKKLLQSELKQAQKNLKATEIRRDILIEAQTIHQKNIDHNQDVMDFYGEKFSNLGLYTWLSATMQSLYKTAFNNALSIARLAEQAYRYERDDTAFFIDGNYFDPSKGGLLAGERLLMALQTMERRYMETNYRKNEIDQPFSLMQIDPQALLMLKQTASCEFEIPELFFDLFYPGQFKRKIQSVRLTIPCVAGPFTNIGATLSLTASKIRMEAVLGAAILKDVPNSRTTTIATSTAQNDAGVFQINFRDDRYMPFEGAGAISAWKLALPKSFHQFDYQTINDVIIHISYTAEYDELFRDNVEQQNDALEGTLLNFLRNNPLSRAISLRQEYSTDFHRLTDQPVNMPVALKIQNKHFPLFLNGKNLQVTKAQLVLITKEGQTAANLDIQINGNSQTGFARDVNLGNLYTKNLGNLFNTGIIKEHSIAIVNGGDFAAVAPPVGPAAAVDTDKLLDIVLYIEYKLVP